MGGIVMPNAGNDDAGLSEVQQAATFVEEAAKKVQERAGSRYDFGYKAPSSQIGEKTGGEKTGETAAQKKPEYTAIVNNRDGSKIHNDNNSTNHAGTSSGNSNTHTGQRQTKAWANNEGSDTRGKGSSKANISGNVPPQGLHATSKTSGISGAPADGTAVRNKLPEPQSAQKSMGAYNTRSHDMTAIANAVVETTKSQYQEAESVKGYRELRHYGALYGIGTTGRHFDKATVVDSMYYRGDAKKTELNKLFGNDYRVGTNRTNNIVADYQKNLQAVEKYLSKYNINAKNLNRVEISQALKSGKLKHWYHHGDNIKIEKGSDLEKALKEMLFLREQGDTVKHYAKHKGGIKNTVKAQLRETAGDSDVSKGYSVYSTSKSVAKAGIKTTEVLGKGAIKTGINGIYAVKKAPVIKDQISTKVKIFRTTDVKEKARLEQAAKDLKERKFKLNTESRTKKAKVNNFNPIKNTKSKIKGKVVGKIESTRPMQALRKLQQKLGQNKVWKALGAPGRFVKRLKGYLRKVMIGGAAGLFFFVIAVTICLGGVWKIGSATSDTSDDDVTTTNAQTTINYLYTFQNAYANNIYQCNASRLSADGTLMIEKGLPDSWKRQMEAADSWIEKNDATVYYNGEVAGYDLSKYWGQMSDKNDLSAGYDSFGNQAIYTSTITIPADEFTGHWVGSYTEIDPDTGEEYTVDIYEKTIYVDFCGYAGFEGDGGIVYEGLEGLPDYSTIAFNYVSGTNDYTIEGTNGAEMLANWKAKDNDEIYVNYYYRGSEYSCHLTGINLAESTFTCETHGDHNTGLNKYHYEKSKTYTNTNGETVTYDVEEFYKAILTVGLGLTDNNDSWESNDFFKDYCKLMFDQIMEDAYIELLYRYEDDTTTVEWTVCDTDTGAMYGCSDKGLKCVVNLNIYINDCGVVDMMNEDAKVAEHSGDTGNTWVHEHSADMENNKFYVQDSSDPEYQLWYTTYKSETELPLWGAMQTEKDDESILIQEEFPDSPCDLTHTYTTAMSSTVEYANYIAEDWKESIYGLLFPKEISIANFMTESVKTNISNMSGLINGNIDWDAINWDEFTTGDASLDEFMQYATTQGWIQRATGQEGLCYYTSLMMVAMYYHPDQAEYIMNHLTDYAQAWCASDGTVLNANATWGDKFNLNIGTDTKYSTVNDMISDVTGTLEMGTPLMLHIKGEWSGTTGTYHTGDSQHFLVIYSANNEGVMVADPAGTATGKVIPWSSLYEQIGEGGNGYGIRYIDTLYD
jgi:hypothetical protein